MCALVCSAASGAAQAQTLAAPDPLCHLTSADSVPGAALPAFDPAAWSIFTPRTSPAFQIIIDDPAGQLTPWAAQIHSNLGAACARWGQVLDAPAGPALITVLVRVDNTYPRATGRSETTAFVGTFDGVNTFDQSAAYEVRTGVDPNGATHDAIITLNTTYVADELWFDPDPATRTVPVPTNRTDAVSVFLHELGHVFMFNGWRDNVTGQLPSNYQSPFDRFTSFDGNFWFFGGASQGEYGGDVPLTYGNAKHVGNQVPRPGSDLIPDLMNGIVFYRGSRYDISGLDLAVGLDCGVTVIAPGAGCDSVDFNNDGLFPDTSDIDDFLSVFSGGACSNDPNCSDIDFNNDGLFPDTLDIDALLSVFSGGACLA
jgi:hypothetical protein